jgi:hypothetical protein
LLTPWSIKRPYIWLEIGAIWGQGQRIVGVLYGISVKDLVTDEGTPAMLKRITLVEINKLDEYFRQLSGRVEKARQGKAMAKYDVFVSYHHSDAPLVRDLVQALKKHHLTVWYDDESIRAGESFMRGVEEALEQSQVFLCVISPNYVASQWGSFEFGVALGRAASSPKTTYILPVLVKPAVAPGQNANYEAHVKKYEALDATRLSVEQIATKVAEAVKQVAMAS